MKILEKIESSEEKYFKIYWKQFDLKLHSLDVTKMGLASFTTSYLAIDKLVKAIPKMT